MSAPPSPVAAPVHQASPSRASGKRSPLASAFSWISVKGCKHALKLRHSFKLDKKTRVEIGLDLDVLGEEHALNKVLATASPWASCLYRFHEDDPHAGALEVTPDWVAYQRRYRLGTEGAWWAVPFDASLGLTYAGRPHMEVGLLNLPLALTLAAGLLYSGAPISVKRKEVGGLAVHFPLGKAGRKQDYSLQERVELDAKLQRAEGGGGLQLAFSRINGVLRLREDE